MENKKDILEYISGYCSSFWTKEEHMANDHYFAQTKYARFKDRSEKVSKMYDRMTTNDPKVLELLENGYTEFRQNVIERIYNEHYSEIEFNRCPKCKGVARTPKAKQCRYCRHDWH